MVKTKAKWIVQKLEEVGYEVEHGEIVTGSRLFYLGKSYYVELIWQDRKDIDVTFIHSKFKIYTSKHHNPIELNEVIDRFYKQKAEEKITKLVKKYMSDYSEKEDKLRVFEKSYSLLLFNWTEV